MSLKFHEMTIDAYLSALGSTAPAPGGGAAAGLIGTQACALGEMVSRLSSSGKNTDDFREKAEQYVAVFESARSIFLDLMDEDAKNFRELMHFFNHQGILPTRSGKKIWKRLSKNRRKRLIRWRKP